MENNKTPSIRFKGFTDPWEQRKVLDLLELLTDYDANGSFADMAKNINTTDGDGYAWYVRITDLENPKPLSELKYVDESSYEFLKKTELHGGELLMAKRGNIGKVYIFEPRTKYATVAPNMYLLKLNNKVIPHFLYDYFVSEEGNKKLTRLNASSTMGALYKDDVKNIDVIMPSIEEQAMIGNFFQSIDHIITLHQRKYNKLLNVKKSMLEKMFPKNGSNIPEIRFKGFTDPWEQRKLGELVDRVVRKNTNNESTLPLTISAQYGLVDQITYFNNRVASRDVSNYYLVLNGEFAYNKSTSDGYPFGAVKRLDLYEKGVLSTLYIVFAPKKEQQIDSDFLSVFFDTDRWHKGVAERAAEGARNHGLLNISAEDFFDIDLSVPKDVAEQKQIGAFIRHLDNLITLHQRELEKLQNIKKSMLEKMFV